MGPNWLIPITLVASLAAPWGFSASVSGSADGLNWSGLPANTQFVRVTGPLGFYADVYGSKYTPAASLPDGRYRYSVTGATSAARTTLNPLLTTLNDGRDEQQKAKRSAQQYDVLDEGHFRIESGVVVQYEDIEEASSETQE